MGTLIEKYNKQSHAVSISGKEWPSLLLSFLALLFSSPFPAVTYYRFCSTCEDFDFQQSNLSQKVNRYTFQKWDISLPNSISRKKNCQKFLELSNVEYFISLENPLDWIEPQEPILRKTRQAAGEIKV